MSLSDLLSAWRRDPGVSPNVAAWRTLPARPARFAPFPDDLDPALAGALRRRGIRALYAHQAAAWGHAQAGRHPVIVTGTASGKTLCYTLPVLQALLGDPHARALYLFPTKALAQDQKDQVEKLISPPSSPIPVSTYDGDTPAASRPAIRARARLIITNPDMLHTGILPHHTAWADLFRGLRFVVIDEMHAYRGVFGSHVANVLRRLKRVAQFYGAAPQFILTSATLANPAELAERLIEAPVALVDDDGSARGEKHLLIYNPPVVNRDLGLRRSSLLESVRLAQDLLRHDVQTLVFGRTRRAVELMLTYLRRDCGLPPLLSPRERGEDSSLPFRSGVGRDLMGATGRRGPGRGPKPETRNSKSGKGGGEAVRAYRSGYLPGQRREIEAGLRDGGVRAVVATNALELGIDVGGLGAALLTGYPGTIAGTWQQIGRAGRGDETSLAALIASAGPLDQFLARHPDYFFGRSPERALINPDNPLILLGHLRCAAFELPFRAGEGFGRVAGERVAEFLQFLQASGVLHRSGDRYFWMADRYPAQGISLRSASSETVLLQAPEGDACVTVGTVDRASACWMVHPQAVYLHEGRTYCVDDLDLTQNIARLRPLDADHYTEPQTETTVQLIETLGAAEAPGATKAYGEIAVTTRVVGFHRVRWFTHERLGAGDLSLPPSELQTTGYWFSLTEQTVEALRDRGLWRNDPNDYGPGWPAQRDLARARDGFRCQACGAPEQGRAHDVHHKVPFRAFASREQANQLPNLVTLCPPCHRRAELTVRVRSGLAGLAFALGHLAPLFLMCDARDLGVHADPQSPLSAGRPSVVIYDLVPAGIGLSERLFELHDELIARARDLVAACECADGCPSCVGPAGENGLGGRQETLALLEALSPGT